MSESTEQPQGSTGADGEAEPLGGALLRQARESVGVPLEALAAALKVAPEKLEALEADRLDLLPDAVFARGLAGSACRLLKVDPAPVLRGLPQVGPKLLPQGVRINAPFRTPQDAAARPVRTYLTRPLVLAVLALLLGAVAVVLWPSRQAAGPQVNAPSSSPDAARTATQEPAPKAAVNDMVVEPAPVASQSQGAVPAASVPVPSVPTPAVATHAASAAAPILPGPPVVATAPAAPSPVASAPMPPTNGLVGFSATADSWVKVTDGRGVVVLSRLVRAGETASASGTVPLTVVVGRADVTRVTVRGKPMELAPVTRENVARFEVK